MAFVSHPISFLAHSLSSTSNLHPREDKKDHSALAERLVRRTGFPVAVPNYRLSPRENIGNHILRHPSHASDILQFLEFLLAWDGFPGPDSGLALDAKGLLLMGHSCSAHMLAAIFLDSSAVTPNLTPSPALLNAVKGIVTSEGIYDLELLCSRFPDYLSWFIAPAFGNLKTYAPYAVTNYNLRRPGINWLLIHSQGDTLVDVPQSEKMLAHLKSEYGPSANGHIFYDTSLTQGHNDILVTDEFVQIVGQFVEKVLT